MAERSDVSQGCHRRSLSTLPHEILHLILDYLSCPDFNSFVQSCRWASQFNGRLYDDNDILFYAAKWDKPKLAEIALKATTNVNRREPKLKITALAMAFERASSGVAKLILQHPDIDVSLKTNGVPLLVSAASRERELWSMVLDRTLYINLNERWSTGGTPLTQAIDAGNTELACLLLERQADAFTRDGFHNMSPLEHAARRGNVTIAELLLQGNAKAQIANSPGVLAIAADSGSVEMAELLYNNGAGVNEKYPCWTAEDIECASETDESEQASTDESEPYADECRWPHRGRTALVIAAHRGRGNLVEWLLDRDEIQLNSTISQDALYWAVLGSMDECVLRLLRSPKVSVADEWLRGLRRTMPNPHFGQIQSILGLCIGTSAAEYQQALRGTQIEARKTML